MVRRLHAIEEKYCQSCGLKESCIRLNFDVVFSGQYVIKGSLEGKQVHNIYIKHPTNCGTSCHHLYFSVTTNSFLSFEYPEISNELHVREIVSHFQRVPITQMLVLWELALETLTHISPCTQFLESVGTCQLPTTVLQIGILARKDDVKI